MLGKWGTGGGEAHFLIDLVVFVKCRSIFLMCHYLGKGLSPPFVNYDGRLDSGQLLKVFIFIFTFLNTVPPSVINDCSSGGRGKKFRCRWTELDYR